MAKRAMPSACVWLSQSEHRTLNIVNKYATDDATRNEYKIASEYIFFSFPVAASLSLHSACSKMRRRADFVSILPASSVFGNKEPCLCLADYRRTDITSNGPSSTGCVRQAY